MSSHLESSPLLNKENSLSVNAVNVLNVVQSRNVDTINNCCSETMVTNARNKDIISLSINEEHNLFAASLESGVRVYNVDPLVVKANLDFAEVGSIAICQLLHRTNLIALVAGGSQPKFAENTVLIWDDVKKTFVLEFTFSSAVLAIKTRRDRLVVVERNRIHCFSFPQNTEKLFTIETRDNPLGLCQLSPYASSERQLIVFPGNRSGSIHMLDITKTEPGMSSSPMNISAHQTSIACLAINKTGTMIATASTKGTLIRVFDTVKRSLLVELRRGADPATLYCIAFSHDSDFLVVSSDKGTVHIFALKDTHLNRRSTFSSMSFVGQYVESQWALAKFTIAAECACICAFGPNSSVYAICVDGTFHKYIFTPEGACNRDGYDVFLDVPEDDEFS